MPGHDLRASTAENYRAFALEALGRSAAYAELATAVAGDSFVLAFLDNLPAAKRQPNLLFAAACYLLGEPAGLTALRMLIRDRRDELTRTMLTRRTQTNEPPAARPCCQFWRSCRNRWRWWRWGPAPGSPF